MKKYFYLITLLFFVLTTNVSAQNPGDTIFNYNQIHTIQIQFSQPNFWDSLTIYYAQDKPMMGTVTIMGVVLDSVGIQLKGNSSYNSMPTNKKSMKLSFDEYSDQKFNDIKKLNLNNGFKDPTMMREKVMLDFCNEHGVCAPRCTYAKVFINGTYWGLYTLVEQVDKTFLKSRFDNKSGNLFKGDPQGSLQWMGNLASSYYSKYELKTNEDVNDWSDLVNLIDKINNTPAGTFVDSMETVLNANAFFKVWASNSIFANMDSYLGSGHNYYIYDNKDTKKFEFITWDVNEGFGNFNMGMSVTQLENMDMYYNPQPANSRPLVSKMLSNTYYKSEYTSVYCYMMNDFNSAKLNPKIDSIANVIRTDLYADTQKQYSNQAFESNISSDMGATPGLKSFITTRGAFLTNQLVQQGCFTGIQTAAENENNLSIFPNPAKEGFYLTAGIADQVQITDITGRNISHLFSRKTINANQLYFKVNAEIPPQVVLISVIAQGGCKTKKLILE